MFVKVKRKTLSGAESQSKKSIKVYTKIPEMSTADKLAEIMRLAYEINPTETTQEKTGYKPTIWVDFFGATCFSVSVYRKGHHVNAFKNKEVDDMYIRVDDLKDSVKLDEAIEMLQKIKEEIKCAE